MMLAFWSNWFAAPLAMLGLFGLFVPLVVFYFLKLRRPKLDVPSLVLWQRVMEDQRVNSPFQRFQKHLLLLFQAIILLLLILAALQPFIMSNQDDAEYQPVLIDVSASMSAIDPSTGKTRLDIVKEMVLARIEALGTTEESEGREQQMSIVVFDNKARRKIGFTSNKHLLRQAVREIESTDTPSDIGQAMQFTKAMQRVNPFEEVIIYSDKNFPQSVDFDLSFKPSFMKIEAFDRPVNNIGITSLKAEINAAGTWTVFTTVHGSSIEEEGMTGNLKLYLNDQEIDSEPVDVSFAEKESLLFQVRVDEPSILKLELTADGFDALSQDNIAYLGVSPRRDVLAYVPENLGAYRFALASLPGIQIYPDQAGNTLVNYDLVISDNPEDAALAPVSVMVGVIPEQLKSAIQVQERESTILDWEEDNSLMAYMVLTDLTILDRFVYAEGFGDPQLESLNYQVIAEGPNDEPLILEEREEESRRFHILFDTDRSTLPWRVAFPIMVQNMVNMAREYSDQSDRVAYQTGVFPALTVKKETEYQVVSPDNKTRTQTSNAAGALIGVSAPEVGVYEVKENGRTVDRIGASLLSVQETQLSGVPQVFFNESEIEPVEAEMPSREWLWPILALLALVFIFVEWWFFHKRPGAIGK